MIIPYKVRKKKKPVECSENCRVALWEMWFSIIFKQPRPQQTITKDLVFLIQSYQVS